MQKFNDISLRLKIMLTFLVLGVVCGLAFTLIYVKVSHVDEAIHMISDVNMPDRVAMNK